MKWGRVISKGSGLHQVFGFVNERAASLTSDRPPHRALFLHHRPPHLRPQAAPSPVFGWSGQLQGPFLLEFQTPPLSSGVRKAGPLNKSIDYFQAANRLRKGAWVTQFGTLGWSQGRGRFSSGWRGHKRLSSDVEKWSPALY